MSEFRVDLRFYILNPSDERTFSYVWIKKEYKTIADLINHISTAFGVNNFHLETRGRCLPASEDIKIIQPDDQIIVLRNNHPSPQQVAAEEVPEKKRKCKDNVDTPNKKTKFEPLVTSSSSRPHIVESRIQHYNNLSNQSNESIEENSNEKVLNLPPEDLQEIKKNKKEATKKLEKELATEDLITPQLGSKKPKKKKRKISNSELDNLNLHSQNTNDSSQNSVEDGPKNKKAATNKRVSEIQGNYTPDAPNNLSNNTKLIQHVTPSRNILPTTVLLNRVNVIKNIVVKAPASSDHVNVKTEHTVDIPVLPSTSNTSIKRDEECTPVTSKNTNCITYTPPFPIATNIEETPDTERVELDAESSEMSLSESTLNKFVTRRKRVRQKKKTKVHQDTPRVQTCLPISLKPMNLKAKPLIHKYFPETMDEDGEYSTPTNTDNSQQSQQNGGPVDAVDVNFASNGVIPPNVTDISSTTNEVMDASTTAVPEAADKPPEAPAKSNVWSFLGKPLSQGVIDKLLPMEKHSPNVNDMIIFQMVKLGEGFTPEVSKSIVGKVVAFDAISNDIQLQIMDGLSEFNQPEGSLLNSFGEDATKPDSLQVLKWNNLINPRLLDP